MKFLYEYRTSDNVKHNGVISAADREAAYAALKSQGIKPSRFSEAPGLFNKIFGKGKRWIAIGVLATVALVAIFLAATYKDEMEEAVAAVPMQKEIADSILMQTRRQVIGDAAVIDFGIRNGWANVFDQEGERFLASFAVPGVPAGQRNTTEAEISAALSRKIEVEAGDSIEAQQIKAMVEGMKQELRQFLADGGTIVEYGRALVDRQEEELRYYKLAKREIENAVKANVPKSELEALWQKRNTELRRMGIKLIPMPE